MNNCQKLMLLMDNNEDICCLTCHAGGNKLNPVMGEYARVVKVGEEVFYVCCNVQSRHNTYVRSGKQVKGQYFQGDLPL